MNRRSDQTPHPHEDRLAAWVLDEEEPTVGERDHVDACPLCARRVRALHRLEGILGRIGREEVGAAAPARSGWAVPLLATLAVAALVAALSPAVVSREPVGGTGAAVALERATALYRQYPAPVVDSLALALVDRRRDAEPRRGGTWVERVRRLDGRQVEAFREILRATGLGTPARIRSEEGEEI
ncbi:MAG: hypothetical protein GF346_04055 [Candidatus Eisenbacteria bacterium]|nr:hypothetical protein [Candidatus Latescibacterota bacterium]MBD3301599.1 hypothetical protein [Candidatus Eisenbacteria bacterium]